jgi:hypothetical protein
VDANVIGWFIADALVKGRSYALYAPDATGLASPVSFGGAIISQTTKLWTSIEPLLAVTPLEY